MRSESRADQVIKHNSSSIMIRKGVMTDSGARLWTALPDARHFYESIGFTQDGIQRLTPLMKGVDTKVTDFLYRMDLPLK